MKYKRQVKGLFAGALAATMVLAGLPHIPAVAQTITETVDFDNLENTYTGVVLDTETVSGVSVYHVTADGYYRFTGSTSKTFLYVDDGVSATLLLDDLVIDNSSAKKGAVIYGLGSSDMDIELSGISSITCSTSKKENAILHDDYSNTMTISGDGSLSVSGALKDAIKYDGGTVSVESGTLVLDNCFSDGIQAENVYISGGTVDIKTTYETASTQYYTSGSSNVSGYNTLWESGSTKYERVNVDTGSHKGIKAGTKAKTVKYGDGTASYSQSASGGLYISGGTVTVDTTDAGLKANGLSSSGTYTATSTGVYIIGSPDDALHSNNDLSITGGTVSIASGDDGITAAEDILIAGNADVDITEAFEGIEGANIVIGASGSSTGPDINIVSADDGINATHKTVVYTYDTYADEDEDINYTKTSVSSKTNTCVIYSGNVTIDIDSTGTKSTTLAGTQINYKSSGDGIDCNGTLDTEALDIAEASMDEESTQRALAGDYEPRVIRFPERVKRSVVRHAFPIAASFALAFIFGVGGSVYAYGEVAETVEMDGVSYDLNYFNKVIAVSVPDADEEMLRELKKNTHGKKIDEAQTIVEESLPHPMDPSMREEFVEENEPEEPEKETEAQPDREDTVEEATQETTEEIAEDVVDEPLDVPTRVNNDKPAEPEKKQDIPGGDAEKEKPQKAPKEEPQKDDSRPAEKKEESKPDAESQPNAGAQPDMGTQPDAGTQPDGGSRPDMETKPDMGSQSDMGSQPDGSHLDGPPR